MLDFFDSVMPGITNKSAMAFGKAGVREVDILDEQSFDLLELGISIARFHHDPSALELIEVLHTVDRHYLTDSSKTEDVLLDDIFSSLF